MAYMYTVQWGMEEIAINMSPEGTSLVVQWLRLHGSNAGGAGLIPGQGTKIPYATWHGQNTNKQKHEPREVKESFPKDALFELTLNEE